VKKILVALDFSELTNPVLKAAAAFASAMDATVYLVHAVRYIATVADVGAMPATTPDPVGMHADIRARLEAARDDLKAGGVDASVIVLETIGNPGFEVLEEAKRLEADLIIVGSHGHGAMYEMLVGSTAELLIHKAPCPVVLVPPPKNAREKKQSK
jgi:nucleotide-binding universal stress UspA family protein